jgi:hypothetical protein
MASLHECHCFFAIFRRVSASSIEPRSRSDYPHFLRTKKFVKPDVYLECREWDFDFSLLQERHALLFRNRNNGQFSFMSDDPRTAESSQGFSRLS